MKTAESFILTPHNATGNLSKPAPNRNLNLSAISCTTYTETILPSAINCTDNVVENRDASADVQSYLNSAISEATRRSYRSDLSHFECWGGAIPTTANQVARYIAVLAVDHAPSTIVRRVASISKAHKALDVENPAQSELVRQTLRGIKRRLGMAQRQAKPLMKEDLFSILDSLGATPKDLRDKALLLTGFAGGFRRSELVGLNTGDIECSSPFELVHPIVE